MNTKLWTKAKLLFIVLFVFGSQQLKYNKYLDTQEIQFDLRNDISQCKFLKFNSSEHGKVFNNNFNE